jgi:hypothetical protein
MTRGTCRTAAKLLLLVAAVRAAPRIATNDGDFTVTVDGGKDVVLAGISVNGLHSGLNTAQDGLATVNGAIELIRGNLTTQSATIIAAIATARTASATETAAVERRANAAVGQLRSDLAGTQGQMNACGTAGTIWTQAGGCVNPKLVVPTLSVTMGAAITACNDSAAAGSMRITKVGPANLTAIYICDGTKEILLSGPEYATQEYPAANCAAILALPGGSDWPSARYWVESSTGPVHTYCDIENGGGEIDNGASESAINPRSCGQLWAAHPTTAQGSPRVRSFWIKGGVGGSILRKCDPTWDSRVSPGGMVAWFKMENYYSGADLRGNPRWPSVDPAPFGNSAMGIINGNYAAITRAVAFPGPLPEVRLGGGQQAANSLVWLRGYTGRERMDFGNIVQSTFTICTTSRYSGPLWGSYEHGRIFQGSRSNWLHGHWNTRVGVAHYDSWVNGAHTRASTIRGNLAWLVMCSTNGGSMESWINYDHHAGTLHSRHSGNQNLVIDSTRHSEASHYGISEVIAWNRGMARGELRGVVQYLTHRIGGHL